MSSFGFVRDAQKRMEQNRKLTQGRREERSNLKALYAELSQKKVAFLHRKQLSA